MNSRLFPDSALSLRMNATLGCVSPAGKKLNWDTIAMDTMTQCVLTGMILHPLFLHDK